MYPLPSGSELLSLWLPYTFNVREPLEARVPNGASRPANAEAKVMEQNKYSGFIFLQNYTARVSYLFVCMIIWPTLEIRLYLAPVHGHKPNHVLD